MELPNATLMFCTGRDRVFFGATWRWLNKHFGLAQSGKQITLACRPHRIPVEMTPHYKVGEITKAIRRHPEKLAELRCYDDNLSNLRVFQTLRPMVTTLRLFRCADGLATRWGK
jgi:hypothetical protein